MSQDARSRSPSPIQFSITDLTEHWPIHSLTVNIPPRELITTKISPKDSNGGFSVFEHSKRAKVGYTIPSQYRDALCVLSAKISWLQRSCTVLVKMLKLENENVPLLNLLDGLRRNLTFSITVRNLFYEDVETVYPMPGTQSFSPKFRSEHLDSWLHVEFNAITHNPPIYREFSEIKYVERYPLDITMQDWIDWAKKNDAEWVLEEKTSSQGKGKGKEHRRLAHRSEDIPHSKFIAYLQTVQKQGQVAGGMSGPLVEELLGEQSKVKTDDGACEHADEGPPPKKRKASSGTSTGATRKMSGPTGKGKGKGKEGDTMELPHMEVKGVREPSVEPSVVAIKGESIVVSSANPLPPAPSMTHTPVQPECTAENPSRPSHLASDASQDPPASILGAGMYTWIPAPATPKAAVEDWVKQRNKSRKR